MITFQNITLRRGDKLLFEQSSAAIFAKQKVGLVGINGSGKSSLLLVLLNQIALDGGDVFVQKDLRISYMAQDMPNTEASALEYVMEGDSELAVVMQQLKEAESKNDGHLIAELHNRLHELDGYTLESRAAKLLVGLGFKVDEHHKAVNAFSGGWRMRLNLARVLMSSADLLLLDEPTNYLDLDAIVWVERWLRSYPGAVLLISHDRDFLDNVVDKIIHASNHKLKTYSGNYSSFEEQRAEQLTLEQKLYKKQQSQIAHLTKFINRFRAKASKARQAQSRIKMIDKMEKLSITQSDSPFDFKFFTPKPCKAPLIHLDKVDVSYGSHKILRKIDFSLGTQSSIGILGINGAGKSTFMKTLAGLLTPSAGNITYNKGLKICYFAQHQIDQLDMQSSPFDHMIKIDPEAREQQIRGFLGGFGFSRDRVFGKITNFSGGERARLVLALLVWQKPNLLLLDEPTNHLDLDMRETLTYALQDYEGAMVLVSHDRHFLNATVDELYLVDGGKVNKFDGDLNDYQTWLLDGARNKQGNDTSQKSAERNVQPEQKKLPEANKKEIRQVETELNKLLKEKASLAEIFSDSKIYQKENADELEKYLKKSAAVEEKISALEVQLNKLIDL